MKKLALSAIIGASLMVTSSAFALTSMTDSNMKSATGQAGVSIAIDNVQIEQYVGSTTYTDTSGTNGQEASIVIGQKHTVKNFLAMVSAADYKMDFAKAAGIYVAAAAAVLGDNPATAAVETDFVVTPAVAESFGNKGTWVKASALSIDVGTCSVLSAGLNDNATNVAMTTVITDAASAATAVGEFVGKGYTLDEAKALVGAKMSAAADVVTGVVIGLPTLMIATSDDSYSVGVKKTGAINDGLDFIKISKGKSAMAILSGTIEIAAH